MSLDTSLIDQTLMYVAFLLSCSLIIFNNTAVLMQGGVVQSHQITLQDGDVQVQHCVYVLPKVYQSSDPQK